VNDAGLDWNSSNVVSTDQQVYFYIIQVGKTKLELKENGEIFHNDILIETDKELVDTLRALIDKSNL